MRGVFYIQPLNYRSTWWRWLWFLIFTLVPSWKQWLLLPFAFNVQSLGSLLVYILYSFTNFWLLPHFSFPVFYLGLCYMPQRLCFSLKIKEGVEYKRLTNSNKYPDEWSYNGKQWRPKVCIVNDMYFESFLFLG